MLNYQRVKKENNREKEGFPIIESWWDNHHQQKIHFF